MISRSIARRIASRCEGVLAVSYQVPSLARCAVPFGVVSGVAAKSHGVVAVAGLVAGGCCKAVQCDDEGRGSSQYIDDEGNTFHIFSDKKSAKAAANRDGNSRAVFHGPHLPGYLPHYHAVADGQNSFAQYVWLDTVQMLREHWLDRDVPLDVKHARDRVQRQLAENDHREYTRMRDIEEKQAHQPPEQLEAAEFNKFGVPTIEQHKEGVQVAVRDCLLVSILMQFDNSSSSRSYSIGDALAASLRAVLIEFLYFCGHSFEAKYGLPTWTAPLFPCLLGGPGGQWSALATWYGMRAGWSTDEIVHFRSQVSGVITAHSMSTTKSPTDREQ
ncbi:unnamed protein product [Prorocentrum cordatum]|uniref:Uncharacterized protein n=1 Tax=Prorocentrum cordatum TaxID=2364126 RepID=A0ABN9T9T3_9DINO|nr:unnamed protein product [Polarella glacialis]